MCYGSGGLVRSDEVWQLWYGRVVCGTMRYGAIGTVGFGSFGRLRFSLLRLDLVWPLWFGRFGLLRWGLVRSDRVRSGSAAKVVTTNNGE